MATSTVAEPLSPQHHADAKQSAAATEADSPSAQPSTAAAGHPSDDSSASASSSSSSSSHWEWFHQFRSIITARRFASKLKLKRNSKSTAAADASVLPMPIHKRQLSDYNEAMQTLEAPHWQSADNAITEAEAATVEQLRQQHPQYTQHMSQKQLMIFLISRHMNVAATAKLIVDHFEWRAAAGLTQPIRFSELNPAIVSCGFTYWREVTVEGEQRLTQYLIPRNLKFDGSFTVRELVCYLLWGYEYSARNIPLSRYRTGFLYVLDLHGVSSSNVPGFSQLKQLKLQLQDKLPQRISYIYITHSTWWSNLILKLAFSVLKQRVLQRINKVTVKQLAEVIPLQDIPAALSESSSSSSSSSSNSNSDAVGGWNIDYAKWIAETNAGDAIYFMNAACMESAAAAHAAEQKSNASKQQQQQSAEDEPAINSDSDSVVADEATVHLDANTADTDNEQEAN